MQTAKRTDGDVAVLRPIGRAVADKLAQVGADTAACLVTEGLEAFATRLWLARTAETSLDLQYYAWEDDVTGRLLANEVLKAADRGVRVRMLLDDTTVIGRDKSFQTMDQHPNIEVRVFNATTWRAHGLLGFGIEFAL
ncbi:MAG TPA: phospholipase D family protein, partial [Methylomirabilota bacterium]|nr:phospholipase D family protein [Methylomirabilota bacterium]